MRNLTHWIPTAAIGTVAFTLSAGQSSAFFPPLPLASDPPVTITQPPPVAPIIVRPTAVAPIIIPPANPVAIPTVPPPLIPPPPVVPRVPPCVCNPRPQAVPEPTTMLSAAIGLGLAGVAALRRRAKGSPEQTSAAE
jgi:hypothetical protein